MCVNANCVCSEIGTDTLQRVFVPHIRIPGLEPASKSEWLKALLYDADGSATAARGVRVYVVFS